MNRGFHFWRWGVGLFTILSLIFISHPIWGEIVDPESQPEEQERFEKQRLRALEARRQKEKMRQYQISKLETMKTERLENFYTKRIRDELRSWQIAPLEKFLNETLLVGMEGLENGQVSTRYRLVVNIPALEVTLYEDEDVIKTYKIAIGTRYFMTPVAHMKLRHIEWNPWWYPPDEEWAEEEEETPPGPGNPLGPVKLPLQNAIMLHGTNQPWSVGRASSHGCLRMKSKDAIELAWFFQSHLSNKKDKKYLRHYRRRGDETFVVRLQEVVPVDLIYDRLQTRGEKIVLYPDVYRAGLESDYMIEEALKNMGIDAQDIDEDKVRRLVRRSRYRTTKVKVDELLAPSAIVDEFFKSSGSTPRISEKPLRPSKTESPFSVSGPYSIPVVN